MGTDWFVANEVAVGGGTCCMEKLMHGQTIWITAFGCYAVGEA